MKTVVQDRETCFYHHSPSTAEVEKVIYIIEHF